MRIGLMGFSFSDENKGCEALTYSMLGLLSEIVEEKNVEILNFSSAPDLGDVPAEFPQFSYKVYNIRFKDIKFDFIKKFNSCDVIFDITYGDGFSDIYFLKSAYRNTMCKWLAGKSQATYILAPQTYGPFYHKKLEWFAGKAIKGADRAYARDQISSEYAEIISKRTVKTVTDLAFALPYDIETIKYRKNDFGLNVSGLLWKGGFKSDNQFHLTVDYRKYCKELIDYLLQHTEYTIHLIPHVTVTQDQKCQVVDSDINACEELKKIYMYNERIIVSPVFLNPIQAKNYIAKMKFFVGARMHSTIAAFSTGVITIPFAYSRKFQGLYNNLGYPYVLDGCTLSNEEVIKNTIDWLDNPQNLEKTQKQSMKKIQDNLNNFIEDLKKILS